MRFYQGYLPAVHWDARKQKAAFEFKDGFLDTDDEDQIILLTKLGYMTDEDLEQYRRTGTAQHGGFYEKENPPELQLPSGKPPIEDYDNLHGPAVQPNEPAGMRVRRQPTVHAPSTMGAPEGYGQPTPMPSNENEALAQETAARSKSKTRTRQKAKSKRSITRRDG